MVPGVLAAPYVSALTAERDCAVTASPYLVILRGWTMTGVIHEALAWAWRWRWLLVMNAFLLSPIVLYELRLGEGGPDKNVLFTVVASVLWLLAAQLVARRVWIAHALMFPLYLVVAADIYVIRNYDTRLASSMILTIMENLTDWKDYLESHLRGVIIGPAVLLPSYAFCMWKIRNLRVTLPRWTVFAPLAANAVVYLGVLYVLDYWMFVFANDRNTPFGVVSQSYVTHVTYTGALEEAKKSVTFRFGARRTVVPPGPELYVLVVGESARKHNWGIYGYGRDTTPRLAKQPNLVAFKDVVTQAAVTRMSVPLILTRATIEDQSRTARERSIVSAFREAGFETLWLSTQQRDPFTGAINRYPKEAHMQRFFERRYDAVLVDTFEQLFARGERPEKVFVVLHTLGSHFTLTSRYPSDEAKYPDHGGELSDNQLLVNQYDNTIAYTDIVLDSLIGALEKQPGLKALFYVSDHGDNLRDDARQLFGHYHNNEYDLPIPMLFWYSDEYAQRFPEKIAAARSHVGRPLNTRAVFYSVADIANITFDDPNIAKLSVLSPGLTDMPRMVMGEPRPVDYDKWRAEHGLPTPQSASLEPAKP